MAASPRSAEEFSDRVGEPPGDRQSDELVVVLLDRRTQVVGVGEEAGFDAHDDPARELDLERDLHVVHRQRFRVVWDVDPRRLLVAHGALDQEIAVVEKE